MSASTAFRGQPLLLLAGLLLGWLAMRAVLWQPPFGPELAPSVPGRTTSGTALFAAAPNAPAPFAESRQADNTVPATTGAASSSAHPAIAFAAPERASFARPTPASIAIGHTLLLAAGLAAAELPPSIASLFHAAPPGVPAAATLPAPARPSTGQSGSRWSGDGWLMLRPETAGPLAPGAPSYGRSQAGAVIRYALAPGNGHRPQAFVGASAALAGARDRGAAAGIAARPVPEAPIRIAVEARASQAAGGTTLHPAAYAVTELRPVELPLALRGEAYLQGGYVGGRWATAFVDGQARVERVVGRIGEAEVSGGTGIWGGAQRGAARIDIGPTLAARFAVGETHARLSADYRVRVAGDAAPRGGPALTLSAGF